MKSILLGALSAMALAVAPVWAQQDQEESAESFLALEAGVPEELNPGAEVGDAIGEFRFVVDFAPAKSNELALIRNILQSSGAFEAALEELSEQIALPKDVPVNFQECGASNAHWSREAHNVTMCYELAADFFEDYSKLDNAFARLFPWADHRQVTIGSTLFVLMHEIGHGMVTLFDLPITGREEDAVDQFALFILTNSDEEDQELADRPSRLALLAAYGMIQTDRAMERAPRHFWGDEHSLERQRGLDMLCTVLGSDPHAYQLTIMPGYAMVFQYYRENPELFTYPSLVAALDRADDLNLIPWERGAQCRHSYAKYEASWDYLIETFMTPKSN